jgi:hypothetical protein
MRVLFAAPFHSRPTAYAVEQNGFNEEGLSFLCAIHSHGQECSCGRGSGCHQESAATQFPTRRSKILRSIDRVTTAERQIPLPACFKKQGTLLPETVTLRETPRRHVQMPRPPKSSRRVTLASGPSVQLQLIGFWCRHVLIFATCGMGLAIYFTSYAMLLGSTFLI